MKFVLLYMLFVIFGCKSFNQSSNLNMTKYCDKVPNSKAKYCTYQIGKNPTKTLWYMHGLLSNEKILESSIFDVSDLKELINGIGEVKVVIISYGPGWMLVPDDAKGEFKLSEFNNKVVPYLESKLELPKPYFGVGQSMGGANLLTIALNNPKFFVKVAFNNSMILAEKTDPWNFLQNCPACLMIKANYSKQDWIKYSPFVLVKNLKEFPRALVLACKKDQLGLYEGPRSIAPILFAKFIEDRPDCTHLTFESKIIIEHLNK